MNTTPYNFENCRQPAAEDHPELDLHSQRTIDLLVDGELSEADQRVLLSSLDVADRDPNGPWRRVALAFIEAQCLRRQLRGMVEDTRQNAPPHQAIAGRQAAAERAGAGPRTSSRHWQVVLAMAASFLVAFALGSWYRDGGGAPHGATNSPDTNAVTVHPTATISPAGGGAATENKVEKPAANSAAPAVVQTNAKQPGLPADHSADRAVDAPIVLVRNQASGAADDSPAVPQRVVDALRRLGHRVEQRRATVPVRLPDGRTVTMPLEQLDVDYKGQAAFQ